MDDLKALKRFVLTAYDEAGYDTTDDFEAAFTFEKTVLFTITIMSTVKKFDLILLKIPIYNNPGGLRTYFTRNNGGENILYFVLTDWNSSSPRLHVTGFS